MSDTAQPTAESEVKRSPGVGAYVVWLFAVFTIYFLSWGFVYRMHSRGHLRNYRTVYIPYTPLFWAYNKTPLHKPLGRYLHFWSPGGYINSQGDVGSEPVPSR